MFVSVLLLVVFAFNTAQAGILVSNSNGITLTGADGITLTGADGITLTGADNFLSYRANGITLTGADGITLTGADGITLTGADSSTYTGTNGITLTGADGITLTGADGITLTGADGITLTGADGVSRQADSVVVRRPNGITLTGADGITLTGADGFERVGANGITLTGADGITLTGADGITLTGADGITLTGADGAVSTITSPAGITLTGADGITLTGADGITLTGADGITLTGADGAPKYQTGGLRSIDPVLAVQLNQATDDSSINAVIVFHQYPSDADLARLQQIGIAGGTRFRRLPIVAVTATRSEIVAVSKLSSVRSIYGNRTLNLNADAYLAQTGIGRVSVDRDLQLRNQGMPVSGKNVTVAVLDTGVNSLHGDLSGRVAQNVKLVDTQSGSAGFTYPAPVENVANTDFASGHGTFVAGVIAGSGAASGGKYNGVAPGARVLGLSAGDLNLTYVLAGFDYLLDKGAGYNARVVNCSFSANTVFDYNDPVNVATKMLTENGISVVFSAGNSGSGNGTLNPYAAAPWVVSVGATDDKGRLAAFSSRGVFGSRQFSPSLVAPAVNVVSLRSALTQNSVLNLAGADASRLTPAELPYYTTMSGTSFSAPQVAGAIALMLEANPSLNPLQIKDILQRTATPLPPYYRHEVGAGMLNVHAAVLQSAFPARRMGVFRTVLERNSVNFTTETTKTFGGTLVPGSTIETDFALPSDTVQNSVHIAWGDVFSTNDLALKIIDAGGNVRGSSNYLNAPGLTGKREQLTGGADAGNFRAIVSHTAGVGTTQDFYGAVEITRARFANFSDVSNLSAQWQTVVNESLRSFVMLPEGKRFRPFAPVSRVDFATALLRGGRVPQYIAANPLFTDASDATTRGAVESAQKFPGGKLFYDVPVSGGAFRPDASTTKLVAAIALVKAANLQSLTQSTALLVSISDYAQIPSEYRGYIAVALQKGFLTLDGNSFAPNRSLTRIELAQAMLKLSKLAVE